ncbi:hypothetical protein H8790_11600 [Oscillibacter hominis]|uniref:Conjugal transfer protein TrbL n=1 Tax=Oscillibacter hominis TaxID=2763056 RepID=A0A7G9B3E5_9FIRM|nr:conjugal transfer protein TrbL family protein [Oscillibacter hominis]QNL44076.1 hypothetical protein H8790_11600 [Oscillibacter hominis]
MLELIFQGFVEWCYGLVLECWEYFSSALLDIMSMDFAYLKEHMPIIDTIMNLLLAVGWALLIGNLIFQAIKTMLSGIGFEGEYPKLLFTRTFVFAFLLLASPQICNLCLNFTSAVIDLLEVPDAVNITFAEEATFGGLAAAWILVVICGIIVMFQSFKLIFEMAERYLILAVLTITAPLAFGMGGSRNTSDIFSGWCRMYGSMCLLMVMNVVFIKMLLSVLSYCPSGLDVLPWMILVLSTVKVAKKIDGIITRIGLNPAITGDSLGRTFPGMLTYMVARTAMSQVTKTIGKSSGGNAPGRGHTPSTPPGGAGGPRSGGPAGSGQVASTSYSQRTGQQSAAYQSSTQQSATVQGGPSQTSTQEQSTGPAFNASTQFNQSGPAGTKKTSVPPGARHTTSHIKSGVGSSVIPGAPGRVRPSASGVSSAQGAAVAADGAAPRPGTAGSAAQEAARADIPAQHAAAPPSESRFTHREASVQLTPEGRPQTAQALRTGQAAVSQPGTAGMGGTVREAVPSRSPQSGSGSVSSTAAPRTAAGQHSPARQEPAKPPRTPAAAGSDTGPVIKPGTAGTARDTARASQGRDTARRSGARAKSTPMADDGAGSSRSASIASHAQKNLTPNPTSPPDRPPRGDRDGRKK